MKPCRKCDFLPLFWAILTSVLSFLFDSPQKFQSCDHIFIFFDMCPKVMEISSSYLFSAISWILTFCIFVSILVFVLAKETLELELCYMRESNQPIKM